MANEKLDVIDRKALIAEYDRVHIGEPGMARKLIEDAPTVDAVPLEQHNELKEKYKRLLETADILDAALREYQRKYGDLE